MQTPVFRFAPSPNGRLHLGHALSALTGFDMARRCGGRFLLRIEDIDGARSRPEFVAGIYEDLEWLGISWETPVRVQSEHFDVYREAAARLAQKGLLFPCFATRSDITAAADILQIDPDGAPLYPGKLKVEASSSASERINNQEPYALRIDMHKATAGLAGEELTFIEMDDQGQATLITADPGRWGDAVIVRKDVPASYHLAVVVDDALQGVTHVTRGQDLLAATDLHRLLQHHLSLPVPVYHHHRLITGNSGLKLSKSAGDTSLAALRAQGVTPLELRRLLGLS